MPEPSIRTLTTAEVETLVDWAAAEGWNPGLADAAAFRAEDPDGFLGAFVGAEMVSGISAVAYGSGFGFIGLYICRPDMRGMGYGKRVWDAGVARLSGRTVGLDGVPAQQAGYRSKGFVEAYRTIRYSGSLPDSQGGKVDPAGVDAIDAIAAFDLAHFPAPRQAFLQRWISPPHLAVLKRSGGRVVGYGVARRCREAFKVGPLFAEDFSIARDLLERLAAHCGGTLHLDVPETNPGFAAWLLDCGFVAGFETARMYKGPAPAVDMTGVFAISSLELG
jgi:hypothetical protein